MSEIFRNGAVLVLTPCIGRPIVQRTYRDIVAALHNNKDGNARPIVSHVAGRENVWRLDNERVVLGRFGHLVRRSVREAGKRLVGHGFFV